MSILLTRRAVVLARLETTYNTAAVPSPSTDGILVESPDFTADMNVLMRDFARSDLSPLPHQVGRKLAKLSFTTELRSNGLTNQGDTGKAPVIARLFQACGYALSPVASAGPSPVYDVNPPESNEVSWATGGTPTNTDLIAYYLDVTTGGASGTAQVTIISDTAGEGSGPTALTSGSALTVGTKGLSLTPTFTGSLTAGQRWQVWLLPTCLRLDPVSTNFSSLTMQAYFDGIMHQLTGCLGTFSIDAKAGEYAKVKWEFTGQYAAAVNAALPTPTFERTLPPPVQLGRLMVDNFNAIVAALTFMQGNQVEPRPDVSSTDGYNGVRIVTRKPEGTIDPEADLVSNFDFWGRMAAAQEMLFQMRVGTVPGNTVWIVAPNVQYNKLTYRDRTGIRVLDAGLNFARYSDAGNDELAILFA